MYLNLQQQFDKVVNHLRTQGKASILVRKTAESGVETFCAYRGADNTSCAAGCLIPDSYYDPRMERGRWDGIVEYFKMPKYLKTEKSIKMVTELQSIHDNSPRHADTLVFKYKDRMEFEFKNVANRFNLLYTPL